MRKLVFLSALFISFQGFAQKPAENVDLVDFMQDVIVTTKSEQNMRQIWWLPGEYWAIALKDSPYAKTGELDDFMMQLSDYVVVAALDVEISPFGSFIKNEIEISYKATDGMVYKPLNSSELSEEMEAVMDVISPMMKAQLGQLGSKYEFFVFSAFDENNQNIGDPYSTGEVSLFLNDETFTIQLPVSALVEKKQCPTDQKLMNGNWQYCPWHGTKLINQ